MPDPRSAVQTAIQFRNAGRHDLAEQALRGALGLNPDDPAANQFLAVMLTEQGRYDQARHFIERAIGAVPTFAEFYVTLASIKGNTGDLDGAIRTLRRALEIEPGNVHAAIMLASALLGRDLPTEAESLVRSAIGAGGAAVRDQTGVRLTLARALLDSMRADEALAVVTEGLRARPDDLDLRTFACTASNYTDLDPARVADLHRAYGRAVGARAPGGAVAPRDPDPERRLRVGLLSPDLRAHSVASFVEPLLSAVDPARVEFVLIFTNPVADSVTRRLRALVRPPDFRQVPSTSDADVEHAIRGAGLDLLVELSGHTAGHRLPLLARRLAPVQVTYLGYPNTTGVPAIDYRIVDAVTDPPGAELRCTERLARLPGCFLCYRPPDSAPDPRRRAPGPASAAAPVNFGSFNTPAKLSPETVDAWARILGAVPGSRLILKGGALGDPGVRARALSHFAARTIDPARVEVLARTPDQRDHLGAYHRLDLALDTYPYCGATTTCEALWMGVPVVTRRGPTHAARVGATLLTAIGLPGLIAESADEFVRLAVSLAADPGRLGALSGSLRERVRASPLCDAAAHGRAFESALRGMWRARCAAPAC